jgi:hypothetical protein
MKMGTTMDADELARLRLRHLRIGWTGLLVFVALGAVLEALHGFKADWYLAVGQETRRLLWRLGHAHGTFLALVHIAFAASLRGDRPPPRLASACLTGALIALPAGFFFGGFGVKGGDPGAGILLTPLGVLLLLTAILGTLWSLRR